MSEKYSSEGSFASPPCFAHELEYSENGYVVSDPVENKDVARWRKAERERLISARLSISAADRTVLSEEIAVELDRLIEPRRGLVVGLYWPFRGELDFRPWMRSAHGSGMRTALPVVVAKDQPLVFREWTPEGRMERGVWNIPIPADGDELIPNVVISPLVGFDAQCFRLGYGGGFYDRTLAARQERPFVIGVGHPLAQIPTIYPRPHDIAMDVIVTGRGEVMERGRVA